MSIAIKRILIANRGAIAVRIIRTLKEMNIESVVVYAEADRESLHVRLADHSYSLGDGSASDTYLNQEKIIGIALESKSQAIHPGYGFLSENTDFVTLCERNNVVFLGPTADQISAFGLKHKARELAEQSGTPLLPGSGILKHAQEAVEQAQGIGYPVMLKSTAGGGGIGMQLCRTDQQLFDAWDSVSKLSKNNFSNADLFIEKFVEHARHIEVQIFADGQGNAVAIGERDCSAQRRNQKVLEETPAPNLSDEVRQTLKKSAIDLVCLINYRSAGTVEFIFDTDTQAVYFLEVNTRLQVEHGVTEEVYGIDIVRCMVDLADGQLTSLNSLANLEPKGHSIQARVYAEDPIRDFKPSAGLLSNVSFPDNVKGQLRIDTWIETGIEVSPFYDPMLAKVIAIAETRQEALSGLKRSLADCEIDGIEANVDYLIQLIDFKPFIEGRCLTSSLSDFSATSNSIEVLVSGTMTTIQDSPGRVGYWDVGIPPSGPFDNVSFRLANALLGNSTDAAGLEMTMNGAHLCFFAETQIVLSGALMQANIDEQEIAFNQVVTVNAGQTLRLGKIKDAGSRSYLAVKGGLNCPLYLGSCSTFTLGQFGGHGGRALRVGDILHINPCNETTLPELDAEVAQYQVVQHPLSQIIEADKESVSSVKKIRVIAGPQGAPDYFSAEYIETFFSTHWKVHYNSSRTGVRLIGPKPIWTREDGGEAGLHPSNIHDNAYAIGTIDFTGDMPVILGPDGPSLGGFVCPATVITADFWMIGQLAAGDDLQFVAVSQEEAVEALRLQDEGLNFVSKHNTSTQAISDALFNQPQTVNSNTQDLNAGLQKHFIEHHTVGDVDITLRQSGDSYLLVEFGEHKLDIELRFQVHQLMLTMQSEKLNGLLELTPGIRSLQVHYDVRCLSMQSVVDHVLECVAHATSDDDMSVPSRIVYLPLSWDDEQCKIATDKYDQSVRKDAPWYPSNIEFIRRINGLDDVDDVKRIVFDAKYLVMGLGDVYLGAPVATPVNPEHRLVTTKYNPARTWTAENSVGIGGSYMCVYGMEGPGGYQFVGRTVQMWNRFRKTADFEKPWLLRFFDQIQFYPVSGDELAQMRKDFPLGNAPLKIEQTEFSLKQYKQSLIDNEAAIERFSNMRETAFDDELNRWKADGQFHFEQTVVDAEPTEHDVPDGMITVDSPVSGSMWEHVIKVGDSVEQGQVVSIVESMKMEIQVNSNIAGTVYKMLVNKGDQITAGSPIAIINPAAS